MPLATAGEAAALAALLASRYISLHTGIPTGGNEVATVSYARQAAGPWTDTGNNPTVATNDALITFPTATADWGAITYFGIYDAVSGGNLIAYAATSVTKTVLNGDIARFPIGSLSVSAD